MDSYLVFYVGVMHQLRKMSWNGTSLIFLIYKSNIINERGPHRWEISASLSEKSSWNIKYYPGTVSIVQIMWTIAVLKLPTTQRRLVGGKSRQGFVVQIVIITSLLQIYTSPYSLVNFSQIYLTGITQSQQIKSETLVMRKNKNVSHLLTKTSYTSEYKQNTFTCHIL